MSPDTENQGAPDTEPLDAEERRLARLLGQLPGSMPSPETDRRILAAAERSEPPKERGYWPWGIGGAVAAGLALAMFWPGLSPTPPPTAFEPATVPAMAEDAAKPQGSVSANAKVADADSPGEADAPAATSAGTKTLSRRRSAVESMPPKRPETDGISLTPQAPAFSYPQPQPLLPPLESDPALAPELWLVRIQDRLDAGQREQAMRSLSLFRQRYPDHPLPETLDELIR